MSFTEVHIRVSIKVEPDEKSDFLVELYDVAAKKVLVSADLLRGDFDNGYPDFKNGEGETLTPARLAEDYRESPDELKRSMVAGRLLFKLLMPGAVATEWERLRSKSDAVQNARQAEWRAAMQRGERVKEPEEDSLVTLLELPAGWLDLPWELLYHGGYLFWDRRHTFGHVTRSDALEANPNWPLRMLLVVGCDAADLNAGGNDELREIRKAAALFCLRLDLEILEAPRCTPEAIRERLKTFKPHIFHFIGHGIAAEAEGYLQLQLAGGGHPWTANQIIADLSNVSYPPWIVVLNACEADGGDDEDDDGEDPHIDSVADAFRQRGCGTIIAMRGNITREGCTAYSRGFYRKLARCGLGRPDLAHAEGVNAIKEVRTYAGRTTWSQVRCIHLHSLGKLFPMNPSTGLRNAMGKNVDLARIKTFVGRDLPRRRIFSNGDGKSWYQPMTKDPNHPEKEISWVMVVSSRGRNGKTWFLMSQVYLASLEGYETFYCDFEQASGSTLEFPQILKTIRDTEREKEFPFFGQPLVRPERQEAFHSFVKAAENYKEDTPPAEDAQRLIIQELANALRGAKHRIFIALDHVHKTNPVIWKKLLVKELLQKVATEDAFSHVRIAVALDDEVIPSHGFAGELTFFEPGRLEDIPLDELEDHFLRYAYQYLGDTEDESDDFQANLIECSQMEAAAKRKFYSTKGHAGCPISSLIFPL